MPKNKVKLSVCGVLCTLLTDESEAYMKDLAAEVERTMEALMGSAGPARRELAALTAALSYCDEAKKLKSKEPDCATAELETQLAQTRAQLAEARQALAASATAQPCEEPAAEAPKGIKNLKNPLRPMDECAQQGLVSFFEIE